MQPRALLALALALVGAEAKIAFTHTPGSSITAGNSFTIMWDGAESGSPVTITLKQGDPNNLKTVALITGNGQNGQYTWTPSTSLPNGNNYALEISQGTGYDETNYSGEFSLNGGSSSAAASSGASGSSAATSSNGGSGAGGVVVTITSGSTTYTTVEPTGMGTASGTVGMGNATSTGNMTYSMTSMQPTSSGGIQVSSSTPSSTPKSSSTANVGAHLVGGIGGLAAAALGFAALL